MSKPQNTKPSPMSYTVEHTPNLRLQRVALAQNADEITRDELKARALDAQVDLSGASTVEDMVKEVRQQVRGAAQ